MFVVSADEEAVARLHGVWSGFAGAPLRSVMFNPTSPLLRGEEVRVLFEQHQRCAADHGRKIDDRHNKFEQREAEILGRANSPGALSRNHVILHGRTMVIWKRNLQASGLESPL